jgi:hypothetical protein
LDAARRANCRFKEALDLLLEGKLKRVAADPRKKGIDALLSTPPSGAAR